MPDKGKILPDKGKILPDKGKILPDKGKGQGNGHAILGRITQGAACIVLRATIETFGPAGDAELNLNVKWPGSALAAASDCTEDATGEPSSSDGSTTGIDDNGNLSLPATYPTPSQR